MSWLLFAILSAAVWATVAGVSRVYVHYQRRRLDQAHEDFRRAEREGRMLDTQGAILSNQSAIMGALIARNDGARRARAARLRMAQRRMLLRR